MSNRFWTCFIRPDNYINTLLTIYLVSHTLYRFCFFEWVLTDTNFSEVRGTESEGWIFWIGSGFSGIDFIVERFKVTNDSFALSKESTDAPWFDVATDAYKILLLNTPNQIPIEGKILGDHVFAMLGHFIQLISIMGLTGCPTCAGTNGKKWEWILGLKFPAWALHKSL